MNMRRFRYAVFAFSAVLIAGCGRSADTHWKDGNFKVYALDLDFNATRLGYDHHPGLLGLVDEEVIAAGSNSEVVVVERYNGISKLSEFYIVPKESVADTHSGIVDGPYSQAEFDKARIARRLPKFTWYKNMKD